MQPRAFEFNADLVLQCLVLPILRVTLRPTQTCLSNSRLKIVLILWFCFVLDPNFSFSHALRTLPFSFSSWQQTVLFQRAWRDLWDAKKWSILDWEITGVKEIKIQLENSFSFAHLVCSVHFGGKKIQPVFVESVEVSNGLRGWVRGVGGLRFHKVLGLFSGSFLSSLRLLVRTVPTIVHTPRGKTAFVNFVSYKKTLFLNK